MIKRMGSLAKEIEDFGNDDSGPEALTWEHSAAFIGLALLYHLAEALHGIETELENLNERLKSIDDTLESDPRRA